MLPDYYKVLALDSTSTKEDIKKRYRELAVIKKIITTVITALVCNSM